MKGQASPAVRGIWFFQKRHPLRGAILRDPERPPGKFQFTDSRSNPNPLHPAPVKYDSRPAPTATPLWVLCRLKETQSEWLSVGNRRNLRNLWLLLRFPGYGDSS